MHAFEGPDCQTRRTKNHPGGTRQIAAYYRVLQPDVSERHHRDAAIWQFRPILFAEIKIWAPKQTPKEGQRIASPLS